MAVIASSRGGRKLLIAVMALFAAPAMAKTCPPAEAPPIVKFRVTNVEPVLRNDRSRDAIADLAGGGGLHGRSQAGLTQSDTQFHLEPTIRWTGAKGGSGCVTLSVVEAVWSQLRTTIDIAAQYPPGSCQYAVVLEHEREHVRLTRQAFDAHAPRIEARLRELAATLAPFETSDTPEQAAARVNQRMMAALRPLTKAFDADSRRLNATIDTPESYRAVAAKCKRW